MAQKPEEPTPAPSPRTSSATPSEADASAFKSFLVGLATDPAKLGAFIKDPDAVMKAAGLDDVDQAILKSGQAWAVYARLSGQTLSYAPPMPVTMLVVDVAKMVGGSGAKAEDQPVLRTSAYASQASQGGAAMYPNVPVQVLPQIQPQLVVHPQIWPQVHPQLVVHPQIWPQVHPQLVVHPQIWPQVHPQLVVHPQIWPQVHPQLVVHPQIWPQVHPQLVVHPQIWPQVHPQLVVYPQIFQPGG